MVGDIISSPRLAECIQCLWWCGVCRPLENTFCCNGYWHVSSEEPGHQLTAAKLARTISTPGWCRLCNEQQGSGQRRYVTSGDMETRVDMDRRGWELETIFMYAWVQCCGGLATTLQSHTERELELCSPVRLHIGCSLQ